MILNATQLALLGDALVIDGSGDMTRAVIDGIIRAMAIKAGITGVVVNGAIRDAHDWLDGDLPVFALGCIYRGPSTDGAGETNVAVSCAGLVLHPGDLVVGDSEGVVSIFAADLVPVAERCGALLDRKSSW